MNKSFRFFSLCWFLVFSSGCTQQISQTLRDAKMLKTKNDFLVIDIQGKEYERHDYRFTNEYLEGILINRNELSLKNYILVQANLINGIFLEGNETKIVRFSNDEIREVSHH